jgi:hypothetical protein
MKTMLMRWILLFSITLPAWGYNLTQDFVNGFYWAQLPIDFIIVDKDATRKALLKQLAGSAINQWESSTGYSLWQLGESSSKNIIRWSTNFAAETRMDPTSVLAVAIRYTNGPYFAKSEIIINGGHSAFNTQFPTVNNANIGTTLVHELGHTMGLDHSENMMAVMAPTLQYQFTGLHPDDLDGMKDAYEQTEHRQLTRYVSPLAYQEDSSESQPLSCGTTGPVQASGNGSLSLGAGILITFVRKVFRWFKSLF